MSETDIDKMEAGRELEAKLRWIFETYGKDLGAFYRDAYAAGLSVKPERGPYTSCCLKCGKGHNKAFGFCIMPDCDGKMGERKDALPVVLKALAAEQEPEEECSKCGCAFSADFEGIICPDCVQSEACIRR